MSSLNNNGLCFENLLNDLNSINNNYRTIGQNKIYQKIERKVPIFFDKFVLNKTETETVKDWVGVAEHIKGMNQQASEILGKIERAIHSSSFIINEGGIEAIQKELNNIQNSLNLAYDRLDSQEKKVHQKEKKIFEDLKININSIRIKCLACYLISAEKKDVWNDRETSILPASIESESNEAEIKEQKKGEGPSFLFKCRSVMKTGLQVFQQYIRPQAILYDDNNADLQRYAKVLFNPSAQLNNSIMNRFLQSLKNISNVPEENFQHDYYLNSIQTFSLLEIREKTKELKENAKFDFPIVIPIVLEKKGLFKIFERKHIVTVIIKDSKICYFDSQGVSSKNKKIIENITMEDVLDVFNDSLLDGKGKIAENTKIMQDDVHNCGVFSAHYIYQSLIEGKSHQEICEEDIKEEKIVGFREKIFEVIKEGFSDE